MSDPYNTYTGDDPQSRSVLTLAKEQKELRSTTFAADKKNNSAPLRAVSELYEEGLREFKAAGYIVTADRQGRYSLHTIEKAARPPHIAGIQYPHWFLPYQKIDSVDDLAILERVVLGTVGGLSPEAREFWSPLVRPARGDTDLQLYTEKRLEVERERDEKQQTLQLHQTFDPTGEILGDRAKNPKSWVPARSWFAPQLRDVRFEDVFTIFPEAENKVLELILGRIGVGPSNQIPANGTEPITHTARSAAVVVGKDAGLGKSTTFNGLQEALELCGFTTATFRNTSERFGMKAIASSALSYKDDTAMKTLRNFLASEETKILVTGGLIHTEEKFEAPQTVRARTVLIANSNDWDPNFMYDLDSGIMDRVKVLSTYRETELARRVGVIGGVSKNSPDLHPFNHVPYLAEELGVDEAALYLWCMRLAADRFYELITTKGANSGNALKDETQLWSAHLRIKWHSNINSSVASAMCMAMAMRHPERRVTELSPSTLVDFLKALYFVGTDPSCFDLVPLLKEDWRAAGCPTNHPYMGFRELRWETVGKAVDKGAELLVNPMQNYNDQIKEILSCISLRDGFKISHSHVHMNSVWQSMRVEEQDLRAAAEKYLSALNPDDQTRVRSSATPFDNWLNDVNYSPDRAEEFRGAAKTSAAYLRGIPTKKQ
jgi:hypothetical protein